MPPFKRIVFLSLLLLPAFLPCLAQRADSSYRILPAQDSVFNNDKRLSPFSRTSFPMKQFVAPTLMVMYGLTGIENKGLKKVNSAIKGELYDENPHKPFGLDNYLIFAPAATVYGLNALGIKGKHNFRDRSMLYLMSNLIMSGTVFSVKKFSHEQRPDGSNYYSFPSGHTAASFVGAEFLRQEYKDISPWYGVAGYAMATTTAYLRMYNNKHWLSDVVAGAGIGIASTRLAYWLYPKIQHKLFNDKPLKTIAMPSFQNGSVGIGIVHKF